MRLIKPYYRILTPINGEEILKAIELAARTCYQSEGRIEYQDIFVNAEKDDDPGVIKDYYAKSARILIPKLMNRNHEAMLEFGGMITVRFVCDRGVSHELVRHRVASFAQESTRYCNYSKDDITFIIPSFVVIEEGIYTNSIVTNDMPFRRWFNCMLECEESYNVALEYGWTAQQARSVLPNSLKTEINVSANIREWRHIFKLRTATTAHPQMRELMCPLLRDFQKAIPILFDDIDFKD